MTSVTAVVLLEQWDDAARRALTSVGRQEHDALDVVVVDRSPVRDPATTPEAGVPVTWLRVGPVPAGCARARGLEHAGGALVAYCDDADEWTPDHVAVLASYLDEHPDVDLVYADSRCDGGDGDAVVAWSVDHDGFLLGQTNYIAPGDVMHRTHRARVVGGFDESLEHHEDWDLWLRMAERGVLRHLPRVLGRRRWVERRVPDDVAWRDWATVRRSHEARTAAVGIAADHQFLASARIPFDPRSWTEDRRLLWHSSLRPNEGYGSVGRELLRAVAATGTDVRMVPTRNQAVRGFEPYFPAAGVASLDAIGFYYDYRVQPSAMPTARVVSYSMWESTQVPREHIDEINAASALHYVPCRQNLESFAARGLRVPLRLLHHGVDADSFPYIDRPARDTFTFGSFGDLSPRKGIDVLLRAFQDEFTEGEPVRLLLKTSGDPARIRVSHGNVQVTGGHLDVRGLQALLAEMDAFVLPSRGEGFGLCGLEAMSTGLPLVATNWSGPSEYLDADDGFPLSYELVDAGGTESNHVRYFGCWAEPSYEELRLIMRRLVDDPPEARARGRRAAARVHRDWTWRRVAEQLRTDLDEVAAWG